MALAVSASANHSLLPFDLCALIRGPKPDKRGQILSISPYIHLYPLAAPWTPLLCSQTPLAGPQIPLAGPWTPLASPQTALTSRPILLIMKPLWLNPQPLYLAFSPLCLEVILALKPLWRVLRSLRLRTCETPNTNVADIISYNIY